MKVILDIFRALAPRLREWLQSRRIKPSMDSGASPSQAIAPGRTGHGMRGNLARTHGGMYVRMEETNRGLLTVDPAGSGWPGP